MWRTVGHEDAVRVLDKGLKENRLAHAYLLVGPPHVGKMTLALELAQALNCLDADKPCGECLQCQRIAKGHHADVQVVGLGTYLSGSEERSRTEVGIDQVRQVQRIAALNPYEGSYRVFIFDGAERLSEEAANCLLKTLEEPPDQVVFLLLASLPEALLPTILSRCQRLELRPLSAKLITQNLMERWEVAEEKALELARISGGRLGWALQAVADPSFAEERDRRLERIISLVQGSLEERFAYASELASRFYRDRSQVWHELELWLQWWRDLITVKEGLPELVVNTSRIANLEVMSSAISLKEFVEGAKAILETLERLELNANPRLALEVLMLALPRARVGAVP